MPYLQELCKYYFHIGEIRRKSCLGLVFKNKKKNSLCLFLKSCLHELFKPDSHLGEIHRKPFLEWIFILSSFKKNDYAYIQRNIFMNYTHLIFISERYIGSLSWVRNSFFQISKIKLNSLCIYSKTYIHEQYESDSHLDEIRRQPFLGSVFILLKK